MNIQGTIRGLALAAVILGAGIARGQWVDFGEGSGTLPGIFHLENFDPSVQSEDRRSGDPQLVLAPDFDPIMVFSSTNVGSAVRLKSAISVCMEENGWEALEGSDGRIFPGFFSSLSRPSRAMRAGDTLWAVQPASAQTSFAVDTYAATYGKSTGWTGVDGSLDTGGITNAGSFSEFSYEAAVAVSQEGVPFVAYSAGTQDTRHIYTLTLDQGQWVGLAGSDETPLSTPTLVNTTNIDPAIAYWRGGPVVAWTERGLTTNIIRMKWFNPATSSWEHLGPSQTSGVGFGRAPQILTDSNEELLYFAYENAGARIMRVTIWDDNEDKFLDLDDPLEPWELDNIAVHDDLETDAPAAFSMALDSAGTPAVAFRAESTPGSGVYQLYVSYRPNPDGWVAVGDPETPGGVTKLYYTDTLANGHYAPSLLFDLDNYLMLAWVFDDGSEQTPTVLLRRYPNSLRGPRYGKGQGRAILLFALQGFINTTDEQNYLLDLNRDDLLDAGDAELFAPDPLVP